MNPEQSAHITSLHLKGYKSIRDLSVDLKPGLNIIIGGNGSGKTNFLEFLDAAYRSDYSVLLNRKKFEIKIEGKFLSKNVTGEKLLHKDTGSIYKVTEVATYFYHTGTVEMLFDDERRLIEKAIEGNDKFKYHALSFSDSTLLIKFDNPINAVLKEKLKIQIEMPIFHGSQEGVYGDFFTTIKLKSDTKINSFISRIFGIDRVSDNNETISSVVNEILEGEWLNINNLQENLKQFSPIKDIKIDWALTRRTIQEDGDGGETASIDGIDFQFFVSNEWINWTQLSDGTKRLFYLIGSVTYADENTIILMEEPELGVHPHQLSLLMNFLKSESEKKQIIITTHAPEVLNCLKANELDRIIVARHEGKAGTKMYKLNEKEEANLRTYMKHEASISDYWLQTGFQIENEEEVLSRKE